MPASDYQYWLGKETADLKAVGKRGIIRRDADDKATGKAIYGRDVQLPGMLYARIMMCPYAHAKIKSLDTSAAEKLPGVRAVLRYDDPIVPKRLYAPWDPDLRAILNWFLPTSTPTYVLGPEAFFEGSPIGVAIAADDLDIADEAMDLVKVEWEVLPFVVDVTAALAPNAPLAYEQLTNYDPSLLFPPTGRLVMGGNPDSENFSYSKGWTSAKDATNLKIATTFSLPGTDLNAGFAAADQTIDFSIKRTEVWVSALKY